jgi:hypothetical protein
VIVKPHTPIADVEAELRRVNTRQSVDIASAGRGKAVNRSGDAQSHSAVELCQIGLWA